ncbi:hypothetical protein ACRAWF_07840 [Streptomyces sp. L7]
MLDWTGEDVALVHTLSASGEIPTCATLRSAANVASLAELLDPADFGRGPAGSRDQPAPRAVRRRADCGFVQDADRRRNPGGGPACAYGGDRTARQRPGVRHPHHPGARAAATPGHRAPTCQPVCVRW